MSIKIRENYYRPVLGSLFLLFLGCTGTPPQSVQSHTQKFTHGEVLYIRYCADCHGWAGRGGGPASKLVDVAPPKLNDPEIYAQYNSEQFVAWVLEGRRTPVRMQRPKNLDNKQAIQSLITYMRRLPTIDWPQVNRGQGIYDDLCINCHGLYGRGDGRFSDQLKSPPRDLAESDFQKTWDQGKLLRVVKFGYGGMPGTVDVLSDAERRAVLAFVNLFSQGFESYQRYCTLCHGDEGSPTELAYSGQSTNGYTLEPPPAFDRNYFAAHSDDQIHRNVLHGLESSMISMPHFRDTLDAPQVREIELYLRSLSR